MDSARSIKRAAMILVGESLREMAVLIAVFAPLDILVQDRSLTARSAAVMLSILMWTREHANIAITRRSAAKGRVSIAKTR